MPGTARDERLLKPLLCRSLQISTVLLRLLGLQCHVWKLQGKPLRLAEELHPRLSASPPTPALQGDGGSAQGAGSPLRERGCAGSVLAGNGSSS